MVVEAAPSGIISEYPNATTTGGKRARSSNIKRMCMRLLLCMNISYSCFLRALACFPFLPFRHYAVVDATGKIVLTNLLLETMFGFEKGEVC